MYRAIFVQFSCNKTKQEQNTDIWHQNVCLFLFFNNTLLKYPFARNNITVSGKKIVQYFRPWSSRSFFPVCKWNHNFHKDKPGKMFSNRDIFIICAQVNWTHGSHITLPVDGSVTPPYMTISGDKQIHNICCYIQQIHPNVLVAYTQIRL